MFLNKSLRGLAYFVFALQLSGCGTLPEPAKISPKEQLKLDFVQTKGILENFEKKTNFQNVPKVERYLSGVAELIARENLSLRGETIRVRIHRDDIEEMKRPYAFPGILISIPYSLLNRIEFENELAAIIALQLAHVDRRLLAKNIEKEKDPVGRVDLQRVSHFSLTELEGSIELGTSLLYSAGYDPRGMVSIFEKFPTYFFDLTTSQGQKMQMACMKQAKKTKNEFIPSLQPIVRSNEFLKMKKVLKGST